MIWLTDFLQQTCNKVFALIPFTKPAPDVLKQVLIVAHRGAWKETDCLENSLEAFRECLNHPIDAIEFDLRWSSDDCPVIHHDANTSRLFDRDRTLSEMSFEQVREEFPQIPSLKEVVQELGGKFIFMIELKTSPTPAQVASLKKTLSPLKAAENYYFMSLNTKVFDHLSYWPRQSFVTIARTNIQEIYQKTIEENWGGLTGQYLLLSDSMKRDCHNRGIKVGTGFTDSKNLFYRETSRQVDWIFTNAPLELASLKLES